tara:strand:- start:2532 stop:3458 length:927 start_codon:yes stop_codon:yes gene_type:complete
MTKKIIFLIYFFLLVNSSHTLVNAQSNIVVKVENEIITNYDIKNKILSSLYLANQPINQENINKVKENALNSCIQNKLKKIELSRFDIKNDSKQVSNYIRSITSRDMEYLKKEFNKNEIDFDLFLDEVETQVKWQKLIFNIYSKKINLNEELIDKEISKIMKESLMLKEFKLAEIEIPKNNNEIDKNNIIQIKKEINEIGFEKTALRYSISPSSNNNGEIGWVNEKSLSEKILKIIKDFKIGEISEPIPKQESFLFLKLIDMKISQIEDINKFKLKENLIKQKKNELFELYSRSHLSKLKNTSLIEYK